MNGFTVHKAVELDIEFYSSWRKKWMVIEGRVRERGRTIRTAAAFGHSGLFFTVELGAFDSDLGPLKKKSQ
jgi:hypothetical protein